MSTVSNSPATGLPSDDQPTRETDHDVPAARAASGTLAAATCLPSIDSATVFADVKSKRTRCQAENSFADPYQ